MFKDFTGIILAGGKSTRMGEDKAFIKIGDQTAIERIYNLLKSTFNEVIIIANNVAKFSFLNINVYEDVFKDIGPLAGIHSGLIHSSNQYNFIISCDMVLMQSDIIEYIVNYKSNKNIRVPRVYGLIQPLCAVYSKDCISVIEKMIQDSFKLKQPELNSPYRLIENQNIEIIELGYLIKKFPHAFLSMNNKQDYQKVIELLRAH